MKKALIIVAVLWVLGTALMLFLGAGWATLFCSPILALVLIAEALACVMTTPSGPDFTGPK